MCFNCCITRKSILIYLIVMTSLAFIFGIVTISRFGSKTDIYKYVMARLEFLESIENCESTDSLTFNYGIIKLASRYNIRKIDIDSFSEINNYTCSDLEEDDFVWIKRLKGFENGLGVVLFVFSILFLAVEILFLILIRGIKDSQLLPTKMFNVFNIIKLIVYILAIIFIFLSLIYGGFLSYIISQYTYYLYLDTCAIGIIIGQFYGFFCFWVYIVLSCGFGKERNLFISVGCESNPGAIALYDVNGNPIVKPVIIVPSIVGINPIMVKIPNNMPYQNVTPYYPEQQDYAKNQQQVPIQQQTQDNLIKSNSERIINNNVNDQ